MNEETYIQRKRRREDLDEIFNLLQLAIFICLVMALTCFSLASALHAGETLTQTLDMENITSYNVTGNSSEVNLTTNLNKFTLQIPTGYPVEEFNISFYGYKADAPVEILYSSGGNSYAPKKSIVITPPSNNQSSSLNELTGNITNPEPTNFDNSDTEHRGFIKRFWDWIKALWQRLFG